MDENVYPDEHKCLLSVFTLAGFALQLNQVSKMDLSFQVLDSP